MQFTKLHSSIFHPTLRKWQESNVDIRPHNLMYPIFIVYEFHLLSNRLANILLENMKTNILLSEDDNAVQPIVSMPGVSRYGNNKLKEFLEPLVKDGLSSVLLFGVMDNTPKVDILLLWRESSLSEIFSVRMNAVLLLIQKRIQWFERFQNYVNGFQIL